MAYSKEVAARHLKAHMALAGVTVKELASKTAVSADTINNILHRKTVPTMETVCEIADALGCTPNDVCGFNEVAQQT